MTRRYGQMLSIVIVTGDRLTDFQWKGVSYHIVEILATWHLRDRWWEASATSASVVGSMPGTQLQPIASDRHYFRVRCASGLICEVYHDTVSDAWVLECVYD